MERPIPDMNALSILIKCTAIGLLAGFLTTTRPSLGGDVLALGGLMVVVSTLLVLFELRNPEPATSLTAEAV